jgi:putative toxin-antitoxin system antitoxin component (TIGR02293 family)
MDATRTRLDTTPERAIAGLENSLDITEADIALALGISVRSLRRWGSGESHPQRESRTRLARLVALAGHLEEAFGEDADEWLGADSRYLGGLKPIEALRAGRMDRVEDALEALDSGIVL